MALLASCWLIVESFIVPAGFLKWFYLSFYIHPLFIGFCRIFLWFKVLKKWLLFLFFPFKIAFGLSLFVFRVLKRVAIFLFSFIRPITVDDVFYDALEPDIPQIPLRDCAIVVSCSSTWNSTYSPCRVVYKTGVLQSEVFEMGGCVSKSGPSLDTSEAKEEADRSSCVKDSWLSEYLYSDHYSSSILKYDVDMSEGLFSSDSIVSSPTEVLSDDQYNGISFRFSFLGINQEFIQETDDSENSSSNSGVPQLLDNMLMISQEDRVSPVSNFDFNDSLSPTDDSYTLSATTDMIVDHEYLPSFWGSNSSVRPSKQQWISRNIQEEIDPFHQKYTSRMRFFNVLYHERLHGMNAILNDHLTTPGFFKTNESSTDYPTEFILWSGMARKRLLRSLEYDLEMIYAAQPCLLWEGLHHQYHKVEALSLSDNSENIVFHHIVSGKFQDLQILLERFVEDQKCECQRSSNNMHERLSFQDLLQVPNVTAKCERFVYSEGYVFVEEENKIMRGEGIRATQVLEAINNCIKAFWLYIKTDEKRSLWKYKGIWRTHPPVEDPQDLKLLYDVTNTLHKKEIMLKDLQGKNRCWLRRKAKPVQAEAEKRNLLFVMIDIKLVQRLLNMSLVSTCHLKWCQEKLNNLDFKEGKVFRGRVSHLFPGS